MRPPTPLRRRARSPLAAFTLTVAALTGGMLVAPGASAEDDTTDPEAARLKSGTSSLVVVDATSQKERSKVAALGIDTTSKVTPDGLQAVLHGPADAKVLREAGFDFTVKDADLAATERKNTAADREYARTTARSPLPSGRTSYRTLADYNAELTKLARTYPDLVKPITLRNKSVEGRAVRGIEITTNAKNTADGKPVFLQMGLHHAREWPTGEHVMEYAYDLLQNYESRSGDARAKRIVAGSRTIIVPVVNPDGFDISRSATPLGNFTTFDYEMKRKNCAISKNTPAALLGGTCDDNLAGRLRGTDLNRNYPGFWGGNGASPIWSNDTYRGDAPGGEPEVDNIRRLISQRQVVSLISNHTYSNLVLRPPSLASTGQSPDEPAYAALGQKLVDANGYTNQASYQLYDTSGSTEDWSYWNTGGFGFTFEIGATEFHPQYEEGVVAEYLGLQPSPGAGTGGNREAYYQMSLATLDKKLHSTLTGQAPKGHTLKIRKNFVSQTSDVIRPDGSEGPSIPYEDTLTSSYASKGGTFTWAVNPSTRPIVAGRYGRDPVAPPQEGVTLTNPAGIPAVGATEESTFTIKGQPEVDNGTATVSVGWPGRSGDEAVDWDVEIIGPDGAPVASAGTLDNPEVATLVDPKPGEYTVRVTNYAGGAAATDWAGTVAFRSPDPPSYSGIKESWTLTCVKDSNGKVVTTRDVVVDRGKTRNLGGVCNRAQAKR
ncbi:M14 family zinc carboxypeptidase [Solicola sp. PLA-1-18]|uniref:M14 family zinc carboxypeptidase n=1 Tax=Solicola sp. PLA-1-18 TaxID=3380532 RepID=UPI003B82A0CD